MESGSRLTKLDVAGFFSYSFSACQKNKDIAMKIVISRRIICMLPEIMSEEM
jgi:hypothetical protein